MRKMRFRAANKKLKGVTTFLSGVCLYMWIFGTRAYIVVCRDLVKQGDVIPNEYSTGGVEASILDVMFWFNLSKRFFVYKKQLSIN